jgi:hypothetical protein
MTAPHEPLRTDATTWIGRLVDGAWLSFLPPGARGPAARGLFLAALAAALLAALAPMVDARGNDWLEATFARTLAALAATRGLDSAISLAQSSEVSFSFGPGGSLGIGQALDPVNDLVEQYSSLLLTSTMALGIQRLGMQLAQSLGWMLFVPVLLAFVLAAACGERHRAGLEGWGRKLFGIAVFARLALPAAGWIDAVVAERFLETGYRQASAAVSATAERIEQAGVQDADRPWYERYNPLDAVGDRARQLYDALGEVGESIVNLAIYFTISTIVLPLGTLWLLARLTGTLFAGRAGG